MKKVLLLLVVVIASSIDIRVNAQTKAIVVVTISAPPITLETRGQTFQLKREDTYICLQGKYHPGDIVPMRWMVYPNTDPSKRGIVPNITGPVADLKHWKNFSKKDTFHPDSLDFTGIVISVKPTMQTYADSN